MTISNATYWQGKLGEIGEIVEGHEDIHQCLMTIMWTQAGSDPHRPEFGVGLMEYVDRPLNYVRPRLVREVVQQMARWEARAQVTGVTVDFSSTYPGKLALSIRWTPAGRENAAGPTSVSTIVFSQTITTNSLGFEA